MSTFTSKLSSLRVGKPVKLTRKNGQIVEGIVVENDGHESFSVKVSALVYMKYSQISELEESNVFSAESEDNDVHEINHEFTVPEIRSIEDYISSSESEVRNAFKSIDSEYKQRLSPSLAKIQSALKNHDDSKLKEAEENIMTYMGEYGLCDNSRINYYYGCVCLMSKNFSEAAEAFKYAGDIERSSAVSEYCSVYYESENSTEQNSNIAEEFCNDTWHTGLLKKYNFFERTGMIESSDGETLWFDLESFSDTKLRTRISKMTSSDFNEIKLIFKITKKFGKLYASDVCKSTESVTQVVRTLDMKEARVLFSQKCYEEAIEISENLLDTDEFEEAFNMILLSYLPLWNRDGDSGYSIKIRDLISRYNTVEFETEKTYRTLKQCYERIRDYRGYIDAVNHLSERCDSSDYRRILLYLTDRARAYRLLEEYGAAINQLLEWLDIVERYNLTERFEMRENTILIELAELYCKVGDYKNAEKYAVESADSCRRTTIINEINEVKAYDEYVYESDKDYENCENKCVESEKNITEEPVKPVTVQEAYSFYKDNCSLQKAEITDCSIVDKISLFDRNHLYALLSWLAAASNISAADNTCSVSVINPECRMDYAVQIIEKAFSLAFDNPLSECMYTSSQVISMYNESQKFIPQYNEGLLISAALRTCFSPSEVKDYCFDELIRSVERTGFAEAHPVVTELMRIFKVFFENTGCTIDSFSEYRIFKYESEDAVSEAIGLCRIMDSKNDIYENQGQVRRLRERMFSDSESELRRCLNIVADNNVRELEYVKNTMEALFIRSGRAVSYENTDNNKIDKYIDKYWNIARDVILCEKRHIARPHDKIKGSKRNNVSQLLKRIISCICRWIESTECSVYSDENYTIQKYNDTVSAAKKMIEELFNEPELMYSSESDLTDWGMESVLFTLHEILNKMNGTYDHKKRKYFFIDFLRNDHVLLDENYMPELQGTFCSYDDMCILRRIEKHVKENSRSFKERISEIFSESEEMHNFRSAVLIKNYAEDIGDTATAELSEYRYLDGCLTHTGYIFETAYQDFENKTELTDNSDVSEVLCQLFSWFNITKLTTDYGFFYKLADSVRRKISVSA